MLPNSAHELARRRVGVRGHDARDRPIADSNRQRPSGRELVERAAIDVGDQVAEAIDAQHFAARARHPRSAAAGCRAACTVPAGRPSAVSSTPLASHAAAGANRSRPSNVRLTVGRAYRRSVSSTTLARRRLVEHERQHAVVGRHEPVVARFGGDAAPRRADARIDDDEKDRARRKVPVRRRQLERAGKHVVGRRCRARCRRASRRDRSRARRLSSCRRSDRACRSRSAAR